MKKNQIYIEDKNDDIIIKVFFPDEHNEIIEFDLKKFVVCSDIINNDSWEEIKSIKNDINLLKEKTKKEKADLINKEINKNNNEKKGIIKLLEIISLVNFIVLVIFIYKFKISNRDKNNNNIIDYKNEILNLKGEMNKLSEENIKLKNQFEIPNNTDSKKSCEEKETLTRMSDNQSNI